MAKLLYDERLRAEIEGARGLLERQELVLVPCAPGPKLFDLALEVRPDLVVLSDRGWEPWQGIAALRNEPAGRKLRLLLVGGEGLSPERRETLAGASVSLLAPGTPPEELSRKVAELMNIATRVTVRARVVFELTGRTEKDDVVNGRMLDISTGGFRLECNRVFRPGESLHCFFSLNPKTPVIFATAHIVHGRQIGEGLWEYGLEFSDIRMDDRRRVAEFVLGQVGFPAS